MCRLGHVSFSSVYKAVLRSFRGIAKYFEFALSLWNFSCKRFLGILLPLLFNHDQRNISFYLLLPRRKKAIIPPVQQNPAVDIGALNIPMRLAINTAQYGRTFQDRSHMFYLEKRPSTIKDEQLFNVQVRGKRGNIVQTYPAVEYDFFPTNLRMSTRDLVHFQWTGRISLDFLRKKMFNILLCHVPGTQVQPVHNVRITLLRRRYNVLMSFQRPKQRRSNIVCPLQVA